VISLPYFAWSWSCITIIKKKNDKHGNGFPILIRIQILWRIRWCGWL